MNVGLTRYLDHAPPHGALHDPNSEPRPPIRLVLQSYKSVTSQGSKEQYFNKALMYVMTRNLRAE